MPAQCPSRRQFLQGALATIAATALPPASGQAARGLVYQVTPWTGPLAGFSLVDTAGKTWRPADFEGRSVLLNFWASWCPPCRAEMPSLQAVATLYGPDQLLVLAVNFKETASRAIKFASTTGVSLPVLLDSDGKFAAQHFVKVFPTTLTLDFKGRPQQRVTGEVDWTSREAESLITGLLKT